MTVNPAITYGMFERVKSLLLVAKGETNMNAKLSPWMAFTVGAISKALATVVRVLLFYCLRPKVDCFLCASTGHLPLYHGEGPHPGALR